MSILKIYILVLTFAAASLFMFVFFPGDARGQNAVCPTTIKDDPSFKLTFDLTATHTDDSTTLPLKDAIVIIRAGDVFSPIMQTRWQLEEGAINKNDPQIKKMMFYLDGTEKTGRALQLDEKNAPYDANGGDYNNSWGFPKLALGKHYIYTIVLYVNGTKKTLCNNFVVGDPVEPDCSD
ncbi:MAG: hypothetical protein HQM16_04220 [Deltaproteobacteria bacterium]|nr:hypothetical protein [Deltaproteobacteria bacterium]